MKKTKYYISIIMVIFLINNVFCQVIEKEEKILTNVSVMIGSGYCFGSAEGGMGFNVEIPFEFYNYFEISPAVSYARLNSNYETSVYKKKYPDNGETLMYDLTNGSFGEDKFSGATYNQLNLDLNFRFKPLRIIGRSEKHNIGIGLGYGFKSGTNISEDSEKNGTYWLSYSNWHTWDINLLFDYNYKISDKHRIGIFFNSYGGNNGYDQIGLFFHTNI